MAGLIIPTEEEIKDNIKNEVESKLKNSLPITKDKVSEIIVNIVLNMWQELEK